MYRSAFAPLQVRPRYFLNYRRGRRWSFYRDFRCLIKCSVQLALVLRLDLQGVAPLDLRHKRIRTPLVTMKVVIQHFKVEATINMIVLQ